MFKLSIKIISLLSVLFILNSCTSTADKSRIPNATQKTLEHEQSQSVKTDHGTLIVKWENLQDSSDGSDRVLDHKSVHIEISVQCPGSEEIVKVVEHDVCEYDASLLRGNVVYVNWFEQLKPVARLNRNRKLQVIKQNDRHCNTSMVQEIDVKVLCESL